MKTYVFTACAASCVLLSCQKDDEPVQPSSPDTATEYYPMSLGSYWIYDWYEIDTTGVETKIPEQDSAYVSGDTLLNGHTYFVLESKNNPGLSGILRDSSGYLVNASGDIRFAPDDFSYPIETEVLTTGTDTIYYGELGMKKPSHAVTIPAGSFDALMLERIYTVYNNDSTQTVRKFDEYRSRNVGLVKYQYGTVVNPSTFEARLVRFHIE